MRRALIGSVLALALGVTPALADGGGSGSSVSRVNGLTGDLHLSAANLGALPCPACIPVDIFYAQLLIAVPTSSAIDVQTSISDAPNGADYQELKTGRIRSGGPLAAFIQARYSLTNDQMAALFVNAGTSALASGAITSFPPITTYLDTLIPVTSVPASVSGGTPSFFLTANNLSEVSNPAAALANLGGTPLTNSGRSFSPSRAYSAVDAGYRQMERNLDYSYWDATNARLRPTNGGSPQAQNGLITNTSPPSFWQMATLENFYYWRWKMTGSAAVKAKLTAQWAYIQSVYTAAQLSSDGIADGTSNSSDDNALKAQYLAHVHEVTGDPNALKYLGEMIAATTQAFKDPNQNSGNGLLNSYGTSPGGVTFTNGKFGMLYCQSSNTSCISSYGYVSESIEAMLASASFYFYQQTGYGQYRSFAVDTYNWIKSGLLTPVPADTSKKSQYLVETYLVLNPTGTPVSPQPQNAYYGKPVRGIDSTYMLGAMAEAVLAARLASDTTSSTAAAAYTQDAANITAAICSNQGYLRTVNGQPALVNSRDPWSDGDMAQAWAYDVLSVAGVDAAGTCKAAAVGTASAIFTGTLVGNQYGPDWTGLETNPVDGSTSWQALYNNTPGNQAGYQQIMTNGSTASMAQAGWIVSEWSRRR